MSQYIPAHLVLATTGIYITQCTRTSFYTTSLWALFTISLLPYWKLRLIMLLSSSSLWNRMLSLWKLPVSPVTAKLVSCRLSVRSAIHSLSYCNHSVYAEMAGQVTLYIIKYSPEIVLWSTQTRYGREPNKYWHLFAPRDAVLYMVFTHYPLGLFH